MDKIINNRTSQPESIEQFVDRILKNPTCEYCIYRQDCESEAGFDMVETLGDYSCSYYDNSVDNLIDIYKLKYHTIGT